MTIAAPASSFFDEEPAEKLSDTPPTEANIGSYLVSNLPEPGSEDDPETRRKKQEAVDRQLKLREKFLKTYQRAIMGLIGKIIGDQMDAPSTVKHEAVSDVWGKIIDKWLRGKLKSYDPSKQRFRYWLPTVIRRDCWKVMKQYSKRGVIGDVGDEPAFEADLTEAEQEIWTEGQRQTILENTLNSLQKTDEMYYEALVSQRDLAEDGVKQSVEDLAEHLTTFSGRLISSDNAKKTRSRAKSKYKKVMVHEIGLMIGSNDLDEIRDAAADAGLLEYIKDALEDNE